MAPRFLIFSVANLNAFLILSGIVVALRPFVFVSSDAMTLSDQTWLYPCARVSADGKNTMERQPPSCSALYRGCSALSPCSFLAILHQTTHGHTIGRPPAHSVTN